MAADQLNKHSKVSNVVSHTSLEHQKVKKKKISHYDLNTRSNISLEWDDKKQTVVPKKEQIGISRRGLIPFLPIVSHCQNVLGDVFAAPVELFEPDNLIGLLSYEVWQTHLSVQEREFLTQFLPEGVDPHKLVQELLAGNNFYFGNPFPKWAASICSRDCHPDAVLRQEQCNKANKIAYYSELHKYHTKMIGSLQLWRERWASCVNPENDFMQKILRFRKDSHKSGSSHENDIIEDNVGATSDSCSWDADDKSYNSHSPDLAIMNGETKMGVSRMVTRPRKGDKSNRLNIESGDGAKYMSYIKVSKEQHERVKNSMKHSNTSIQSRSLNNVLGNLDSFCVQPYKMFEEEERQKLRDHWSILAKKHLPAGFDNWKTWRSAKWQLTKSLRKEMEDKWKANDQSVLNLYGQEQDKENDENENHDMAMQIAESAFGSEGDHNAGNDDVAMQIEHADESSRDSSENQNLSQIDVHNGSENFGPMAIDSNNDVLTESNAFPSNLHEYETMNHADETVGEEYSLPSATSEIWPSAYYNQPTSVSHGYAQSSQAIVLESETQQKDPLRSLLPRRSDGGDSFFYPYANQDRNELLLHSLFKDPGSSYLHEQKLSRLGGDDTMLGTGQFPRNLGSLLPLDQRQKRLGDVYMHQNIQENMFADGGGRFSIPRQEQEHLLPLNHVPDWPGMPASSHHWLNDSGQLSSQTWFPDDEVARDGWSGGVVPNQDIGNGSQVVADESLFSVLSQCNGMRSDVHFGSTGAMEQLIPPGNYVGVPRGTVPSMPLRAASRGGGLNYETQSGPRSNSLGWINLIRSWNDDEL